jgi:dolichyl-phosphate beta-glucosyltransferase
MSEHVTLSIVIPAFNEAARLPSTLARLGEFLTASAIWLPAEVLVVDDGSRDETHLVAARSPVPDRVTLRVLRHPRNRGKGAAVRTGFSASRGLWVLLCDADLATPVEELERLRAAAVEVAVGSRALRRELIVRPQPLPRDLMGRMFNLLVRLLGLTALMDTQCGFKLFDGDLARRLAAEQRLDGFAYDVELLSRAARHGARVMEVPVRWRHVEASRVQPLRHGVQMARDVVRIRWWLLVERLRGAGDRRRHL